MNKTSNFYLACDVLIMGSGLAGQSLALRLADSCKVIMVTKRALEEGASYWAQGGIAAVLNHEDSVDAHIEDTLTAGAELCDEKVTRAFIEQSRSAIDWLIEQGVPFTRDSSPFGYHLGREGGHRHRRIIHAADATGAALQSTLAGKVRAHPNIHILENVIGLDLVTRKLSGKAGSMRCLGAYVFDLQTKKVITIGAVHTAIATGGVGKAYLYTTNPDTSTGDGLAMAWRAGCPVVNMEFIQFHPTCLYHPHAKSFLISEAVRGEGGILRLPDGYRFMPDYDERAELAPRDIVSRAIDHQMKKHGLDCVHLDVTHLSPTFLVHHFPTIYSRCQKLGIDITRTPIPVVPAAHYICGGIRVDLFARTDLDGLYALGEVAHTGLHGANRLASNSLLECVVLSSACAADILTSRRAAPQRLQPWDESRVTDADEEVVISHNWEELRRFMWDYVGIVRTDKRLQRALRRIRLLEDEIHEYYSHFLVSNDLIELRNLVLCARLIVESALQRKESRGLHFSLDYPKLSAQVKNTLLCPWE